METITNAKEYLKLNWEKGVECPCCERFVKVYTKSLNSSVASVLIAMYKNGSEWVHVNEEIRPRSGGQFSIAKDWGLIEQKEKEGEDIEKKRVSGYWRLTVKGRQFVRDEILIPKYIRTLNGEILEFSSDLISIRDSLGKHFNYSEMMNS